MGSGRRSLLTPPAAARAWAPVALSTKLSTARWSVRKPERAYCAWNCGSSPTDRSRTKGGRVSGTDTPRSVRPCGRIVQPAAAAEVARRVSGRAGERGSGGCAKHARRARVDAMRVEARRR